MLTDDVAELTLDAQPASASAARRFVTAALERWGRDEFIDDAALATSELVTNAALHAGTNIVMRVQLVDDGVRVEVHDDGAALRDAETAGRPASPDATTGRGFQVVAALASGWGVMTEPVGKTAWFELHPGATAATPATLEGDASRAEAWANGARIVLANVPVALALEFDVHLSGLVREAQLAADTTVDGQRVVSRLRLILEMYNATLSAGVLAARAAAAYGDNHVTITYEVPYEVIANGDRALTLLDTADALCRQGVLLSLPASDEVRAYRVWCLEETVRQAEGEPARPCPFG